MNNIIYINEDNRCEDEDAWIKNFNNNIQQADISIAYSNFLEEERRNAIIELAHNLSERKIVIYEQSMDKGGGGCCFQSLNLMDVVAYSILICVGVSFKEFFKELGKDLYKTTLGKLFNDEEKNKLITDGIVIEFSHNKKTFKYIFYSYLSIEEKLEAFQKIQKHIMFIDKEFSANYMRFIYNGHDKKWQLI